MSTNIALDAMTRLAPSSMTTLRDAIGSRYLALTPDQLQDMEGNIGQLILAQALMFLKSQYDLVEARTPVMTGDMMRAIAQAPNWVPEKTGRRL